MLDGGILWTCPLVEAMKEVEPQPTKLASASDSLALAVSLRSRPDSRTSWPAPTTT